MPFTRRGQWATGGNRMASHAEAAGSAGVVAHGVAAEGGGSRGAFANEWKNGPLIHADRRSSLGERRAPGKRCGPTRSL